MTKRGDFGVKQDDGAVFQLSMETNMRQVKWGNVETRAVEKSLAACLFSFAMQRNKALIESSVNSILCATGSFGHCGFDLDKHWHRLV